MTLRPCLYAIDHIIGINLCWHGLV